MRLNGRKPSRAAGPICRDTSTELHYSVCLSTCVCHCEMNSHNLTRLWSISTKLRTCLHDEGQVTNTVPRHIVLMGAHDTRPAVHQPPLTHHVILPSMGTTFVAMFSRQEWSSPHVPEALHHGRHESNLSCGETDRIDPLTDATLHRCPRRNKHTSSLHRRIIYDRSSQMRLLAPSQQCFLFQN